MFCVLPSRFDMLLQRQQQPVTDVQRKKLKDLAKRLEEGMLKAARSKVSPSLLVIFLFQFPLFRRILLVNARDLLFWKQ